MSGTLDNAKEYVVYTMARVLGSDSDDKVPVAVASFIFREDAETYVIRHPYYEAKIEERHFKLAEQHGLSATRTSTTRIF